MIVTINFAVEGMLRRGGFLLSECPAAVLRALEADGIGGARFDPRWEIFTVRFDPELVSWEQIRRAVRHAGEREGRDYLAIVMSP